MLYDIIKQLQTESSTNGKLSILEANKGNILFKEYMHLVTCPSVNFYITTKTFPVLDKTGTCTFKESALEHSTKQLSNRSLTGKAALQWVKGVGESLTEEAQELFKMLILKDIRAKIGVTLVNKVWPNLCVNIPYQRCSLADEKTLKPFKTGEAFITQVKGDGMFSSLVFDNSVLNEDVQLFTRNGNKFPAWFAEYIAQGMNTNNVVIEGELLCFREGEMLSRKEGNGILNSIMQGGSLPDNVGVQYHVWNMLPLADWKAGKTNKTYSQCFDDLCFALYDNTALRMRPIVYEKVNSLDKAYAINTQRMSQGLEGSIIKTLSHKWKDGTSKECLKLKLSVEIDLIWKDSVEGVGKISGMLGAMCLQSSCGKVVVDVGTGFSDEHRRMLWENKESLHGSVVIVCANDLLTKEGSETLSLFLPVFVELRTDKQQADDLERVKQIFDTAKQGK